MKVKFDKVTLEMSQNEAERVRIAVGIVACMCEDVVAGRSVRSLESACSALGAYDARAIADVYEVARVLSEALPRS